MIDTKTGTLKAAVIGTGKISEEHLEYLHGSDRAELVAICDLSPTVARWASEQYDDAACYTDYRRMLDTTDIDVVHVLTPPHTHVQITTDALNAGCHVISEKPIAPSRDEFHKLYQLAESKGLVLIEDHNYRFNPPYQQIDQMVAQGRLGDIHDVEVHLVLPIRAGGRYADANLPHPSHRMPAGVIHEFITHMSYLLLRFMSEIEQVSAAWSNHGQDELFKYDDLDAIVIGGAVHGRLRFSCRTFPPGFVVTVRGTKGTASCDLYQPCVLKNVERSGGPFAPLLNQRAAGVALKRAARRGLWNKIGNRNRPEEGLGIFLDQTYQALIDKKPMPVSYQDMDRAIALIEQLLDESNRI